MTGKLHHRWLFLKILIVKFLKFINIESYICFQTLLLINFLFKAIEDNLGDVGKSILNKSWRFDVFDGLLLSWSWYDLLYLL